MVVISLFKRTTTKILSNKLERRDKPFSANKTINLSFFHVCNNKKSLRKTSTLRKTSREINPSITINNCIVNSFSLAVSRGRNLGATYWTDLQPQNHIQQSTKALNYSYRKTLRNEEQKATILLVLYKDLDR